MREIKFRAWDSEKEIFIYSKIVGLSEFFNICENKDTILAPQQYPGRKDKNGKEIYEGDIITDEDGYIYVVKYCVEDLQYQFYDFINDDSYSICDLTEIKEIGSIHENPELLKE